MPCRGTATLDRSPFIPLIPLKEKKTEKPLTGYITAVPCQRTTSQYHPATGDRDTTHISVTPV